MLTHFFPDHAISVRSPAGWRAEQGEQGDVWYRHFLGPAGADGTASVSATLLAAPLAATVEDYAQSYLAGHTLGDTREVQRDGARGRAWRFASPGGQIRHTLILLKEGERVYGLHARGTAEAFERHLAAIEDMQESLSLERPSRYPQHGSERFGFSLRVPSTWRQARAFSGGPAYLVQFTSPAVGLEDGQALHASLTLNVERAPGDGTVQAFYDSARDTLGETQVRLDHTPWRGGYVDLVRQETPLSTSLAKRFYLAAGGRGYTLTCEARDDVFHVISRWCELIAGTLEVGG